MANSKSVVDVKGRNSIIRVISGADIVAKAAFQRAQARAISPGSK
jgi:hypothetical protein